MRCNVHRAITLTHTCFVFWKKYKPLIGLAWHSLEMMRGTWLAIVPSVPKSRVCSECPVGTGPALGLGTPTGSVGAAGQSCPTAALAPAPGLGLPSLWRHPGITLVQSARVGQLMIQQLPSAPARGEAVFLSINFKGSLQRAWLATVLRADQMLIHQRNCLINFVISNDLFISHLQ